MPSKTRLLDLFRRVASVGAALGVVVMPASTLAAPSTIVFWTDLTSSPSLALQKDAVAQAAWHKVVPPQFRKQDWVYDLNGNSSETKIVSESGVPFAIGSACKPHQCGDNQVFFVIEPGGHRAAGAVIIIRNGALKSQTYFGKTDPLRHEWLRELQVTGLRALGVNVPIS